ncbi:hypothetical protein [Deinococcus sp.]|uniref:hypothetical protein n=1 Tax=Deinococcus sp. TaxID=47478 RepID=UPI003C7B6983
MGNLLSALLNLRPEGWLVLVVIMLPLTAYFLINVFRARAEAGTEYTRLQAVRVKVQPALDTEDPPEAEEMAEEALSVIRPYPERSLIRRVVLAVTRARTLATPDTQAATEAVIQVGESRLGLVRNVPNLLMLAGLLGTVLGLAGSLSTLAPQLAQAAQATAPTQLARSLGETMTAMQGAFGCSLWGILLSLGASMVFSLVSRRQEAFQDEVAQFVHSELIPAVFPRTLTSQMDRMSRHLRDVSSGFKEIHNQFTAVATQFEAVMSTAGETLGESLERLTQTSAQVGDVFGNMDRTVKDLAEKLGEGVSMLAQAQEGAASSLRVNSKEMQQHLEGQTRTVGKLQEQVALDTERLLKRLDTVGEALGRAGGKFEESGLTFRTEQSGHAARLDRHFETLSGTLAKSAESAVAANTEQLQVKLAQQAQLLTELEAKITGQTVKLLAQLQAVSEQLGQAGSVLSETSAEQGRYTQRLDGHFGALGELLREREGGRGTEARPAATGD